MKYLFILLFAFVSLCVSAQTKTVVLKYDNGSMAALHVPEETKITSNVDQLKLTTTFATLEIPRCNIRRHFVADEAFEKDSISASTPRLILNQYGLTIDDPKRTTFATVMDFGFVGIKTFPSGTPIEFPFADYKPGIYVLPLAQKSKIRLSYK